MKANHSAITKRVQAIDDQREANPIEILFEKSLWSTRFLVLFAILSSILSALVLFIIGTIDVISVITRTINYYLGKDYTLNLQKDVIGTIIGSVDIFLIAVVFLIFSFGLYELFISHIDIARQMGSSNILDIESLDQLKDKIGQVIIMALIVKFFQEMLKLNLVDIYGMLFFALSIVSLSMALFLLQLNKQIKRRHHYRAKKQQPTNIQTD